MERFSKTKLVTIIGFTKPIKLALINNTNSHYIKVQSPKFISIVFYNNLRCRRSNDLPRVACLLQGSTEVHTVDSAQRLTCIEAVSCRRASECLTTSITAATVKPRTAAGQPPPEPASRRFSLTAPEHYSHGSSSDDPPGVMCKQPVVISTTERRSKVYIGPRSRQFGKG